MKPSETLNFIDLSKQYKLNQSSIDLSIKKVLDHGRFILGPEVGEFEKQAAAFCQVDNFISCANGTDAIQISLLALDIKKDDIIFVPSFTFTSTAEMVSLVGAKPYFIEIKEENFNIDTEDLVKNILYLKERGQSAKAVITVDLFGHPSNYEELEKICKENNLKLLVDAAQSFGATYDNKKVGNYGDLTTTSFFPAKPLGCYGDGGAILTNNKNLSEKLKSLRVHGKGKNKYDNIYVGVNSRLDTIQAAILIEKLKFFPKEIILRNNVAKKYNLELSSKFKVPKVAKRCLSVWAQYTIVVENKPRDKLMSYLKELGIPTAVYYPRPLHLQPAYKDCLISINGLSLSESLSNKCLSLPMHPYLTIEQQNYITKNILAY